MDALSLRDMPKQKTGTLNIPEAKKAQQSGKIAKEERNPTYCVYEPPTIPDSLTGLFTITHFILMPLTHLQMRASRHREIPSLPKVSQLTMQSLCIQPGVPSTTSQLPTSLPHIIAWLPGAYS